MVPCLILIGKSFHFRLINLLCHIWLIFGTLSLQFYILVDDLEHMEMHNV